MFLYVLLWFYLSLSLYVFICLFIIQKYGVSRGAHGLASWYVSRIEIKAGKYMSHGQTWSNHVLFWDIALLFWEIQTIYIYIINIYVLTTAHMIILETKQSTWLQVHPQGVSVASCSSEEPWPNELLANWDLKSSLSNLSTWQQVGPSVLVVAEVTQEVKSVINGRTHATKKDPTWDGIRDIRDIPNGMQ